MAKVEKIDAVVVAGKFTEILEDGTRRRVTPQSENTSVRVTPSQFLAFQGTLQTAGVAKANVEAQRQMEKAREMMASSEEKAIVEAAKATSASEKTVEKAVNNPPAA